MEPFNPYAKSMAFKNAPDTFKTTYGTSYKQLSTLDASPVYDKMREYELPKEMIAHFPVDLSPYPMARDDCPIIKKRPYQQLTYDEEMEYDRVSKVRDERSRFETSTLRRDGYREPLPANRHGGRYDELERYEAGERHERGRPEVHFRDRAEMMRTQYDDLLADGRDKGKDDFDYSQCDKCERDGVCMNRLGCNHKFCDDCLKAMHGSDNPFRDSIRWHYCCAIPGCNKWTADPKLVRTDPYGRRLVKFHDVGYFKTS